MNRTVVSAVAVFALVVGATLATTESAQAGHCGGGLFSKLHAAKCGGGLFSGGLLKHGCGGGLLAKLKARHASCCEPEPVCCEPEPVCCEPAPEPCCEPAPAPCCEAAPEPACCEPAPEPCCEPAPAPCCGEAAPVVEAPCCGGESVMSTEGYDLAPGETIVPDSVQTAPAAETAVESASDAGAVPPAPKADAKTDI